MMLPQIRANCPVEPNKEKLTISYSTRYEAHVKGVLRVLGKRYKIEVEDV